MQESSCSAADAVQPDAVQPDASPVVPEIVIVDANCTRYEAFVEAAQAGTIGLHFCTDGRSAVRLARRFRADAWLIAADLPDVSGFDLLDVLRPQVLQGGVDPLIAGARRSLEQVGTGRHAGIFMVADAYRLEDEQRALESGIASYVVGPVTGALFEAVTNR